MGGRAFLNKGIETKRLTVSDRDRLKTKISNSLYGNVKFSFVRELGNKTSFGDLDVLVVSEKPKDALFFLSLLPTDYWLVNNTEVSLLIDGFQVDFIHVLPENLGIAKAFYEYNDRGLITGLIARCGGFKFGPDGLWKRVEWKSQPGKVLITSEAETAYRILDLESGHEPETPESVYQWASKSSLFHTESLFALNNKDRTRNVKRPNYLKWVEMAIQNPSPFPYTQIEFSDERIASYLKPQEFQNYIERKKQWFQDMEENDRFHSTWSFKGLCKLIPNFDKHKGPEIGNAMQIIKSRFQGTEKEWKKLVLSNEWENWVIKNQ